ncbi:hypothetical protein LOS89_10070 [Flavobacterium channae]|uniref:hypothetical protein n=1 Tax=Flavobacterium channae TaxID=2897181 RepID=UPI001E4557F0|nr:hypothetical protein [Flavobacterium channae]UGS23105.1 hypothetical protein LOS89_10070 [Flavobacterium channae]
MIVTPSTNYTFTIGTGGAGGAANTATGGNGGDSTINFGGLITAGGGTGGARNNGAVGTGGVASGGTTNTNGNPGMAGTTSGGNGGSAPNGGTGGTGSTNAAGNPGNTPGGGGGGGERGGGNQPGGSGARGEIRFTYTVTSPCTSAINLPCGTTNLAGTTVGSSNFTHNSGCLMSNYGAWYTFVGDGQQTTITSTAGAGFDHEMSISSGSCGTLTNIACQDSGLSGGTETYTFISSAGVNYYVYIAYYSSTGTATDTGTFTISRTCTPIVSPANDNCSGAIALTVNPDLNCGTVTSGTVQFATDSGITGSGCFGTDDDDVWYRFVATNTTHHVSLLNISGSATDLYHAVYSGASGCGSLGAAITCSDPNSSILTGLTIGQTYYVQVYSYTSTTGQNTTFNICIGTPPPPPSNDNCSGAITLTVNPDTSCAVVTAGTVASATDSGIAGSGCFGTDDDDVWYRFVATNTTHYVNLLNVTGSATDMYHAVYSGASGCGTLGAAILCSDSDSSIVNGLTIGQTYYVQVYTYTSTGGQTTNFNICIGTPPPPPSNDNCSGAISLTVNTDLSCTTTTAGSVASATDSGIAGSG